MKLPPTTSFTSANLNMQNSVKTTAQNTGQNFGNNKQQALTTGKPANTTNLSANRPLIGDLVPAIVSQLDNGKALQLKDLYDHLQRNKSYKDEFMRRVRTLVGDHMLQKTIHKLRQEQSVKDQMTSTTYVKQEPSDQMNGPQHDYRMPAPQGPSSIPIFESSWGGTIEKMSSRPVFSTYTNMREPMSITPQLEHQNVSAGNSLLAAGGYSENPQKMPTVGQKKISEAHVSSLSMKQKVSAASSEQSSEPLSEASRKAVHEEERPILQKLLDDNGGDVEHPHSNQERYALVENVSPVPDSTHDFTSSSGLQRSSLQPSMQKDQSLMPSTTYIKEEPLDHNQKSAMSVTAQLQPPNSAGNFLLASGSNAKTPPKMPTVGQKNPSETLVSSPSKKQKVSAALLDQSIQLVNDVTAVSEVNLREEEEQLFSGSKEDNQLSEASEKAVQEEERPILQKTHMIKCGGRSSDVEPCSSQLLEDNDAVVEHLDSNEERRELVESLSPMPDSVEKSPSPPNDKICIHGYKIKRSNATIFEAIFKTHGDIFANCIVKSPSTRSYFIDRICKVVREIQTNDLIEMGEIIESHVSDAENIDVDVSWIRAHFNAIYQSRKTSENHSVLMAMKENMTMVIQTAEMDRAKRNLELSAAKERFERADNCVRALLVVEKNLSDKIQNSKEKIDSWVKHSVV